MAIDSDIAELDLEAIEFKACVEEGWTIEQVFSAIREYRAFLHAIRNYPRELLAPTKHVDTVWHHHILDTRKYIEDCQRLFGRYIHHNPYAGMLGEADATTHRVDFYRSQALLEKILEA